MADRKELLQSNIPRKPKPTQVFRTQVSPTTPSVMRPSPSAGKPRAELASFLSNLTPTLGKILVERREQEEAEQRALGIASIKNSTPEQLKKLSNAIKNNTISEGQSYAFREGVDIAYAQRLSSQYNEELFEAYETSGVKNNESSGALEAFMDEFDRKFQETHFGKINPMVLQDHFYPFAQGIRNQVSQRHTEYQNDVYRQRAYNEKQGAFFSMLRDFKNDMSTELVDINKQGPVDTAEFRLHVKTQEHNEPYRRQAFEIAQKLRENPSYKLSTEERNFLRLDEKGREILELHDELNNGGK